jgi:hypothetical protein
MPPTETLEETTVATTSKKPSKVKIFTLSIIESIRFLKVWQKCINLLNTLNAVKTHHTNYLNPNFAKDGIFRQQLSSEKFH